ncbi:MAG: HAD-IIB family hydrolase [Actinomycetota bacterium]|nr:HAD-IIB family hydrolase [Actinomycetota bacterium]
MADYKFFKDYKEEIKESLKELKVIYTDLDGTLFNERGCLIKDHENNYYLDAVRLFRKIRDREIDIVMISGRNRYQLRYIAQMIGLKNYVSELGAELVYNLGEKVYPTFDDNRTGYELTGGGKDLIKITELLKKSFPGRIESKIEWSKYRAYNALFFGEIDLDRANRLIESEGYKGLALVDNGFSSLVTLDIDVKRLHIYNLMPAGVNKSNGIILDKKKRNFAAGDCIAIGDSLEDLKMADEVKYFFLMKNALEHKETIADELKKYKNVYITEGEMNRGWAEVMGYLLD